MPVVRFKARTVTLMLITLNILLQTTTAKPLEVGEGESTGEANDYQARSFQVNPSSQSLRLVDGGKFSNVERFANPFRNFQGANIQFAYRDEKGGDDVELNEAQNGQSNDAELPPQADEVYSDNQLRRFRNDQKRYQPFNEVYQRKQPNRVKILDNQIHLVDPRYVANVILTPVHTAGEQEYTRDRSGSNKKFSNTNPVFNENFSEKPQKNETKFFVNIPTQDVGEEEDQLNYSDETLEPANSHNIAFSYSHYVPNYQPVPQHFFENANFGDHKLAPMSFVFHPTVLRGTQPNLVLQELKSFALQLDHSPIMNALFSPTTVPVPQSPPAWPSKYEAQKYLPPNHSVPQIQEAAYTQGFPTRRAVVQINGENSNKYNNLRVDPSSISNQIQASMAQNSFAINNLMNANMRFPSQNFVSRSFASNSHPMNNYYTQQPSPPQFPAFPRFSNHPQQQQQHQQHHQQQQQQQGQNYHGNNFGFPSFPGFPVFPQIQLNIPKIPYISPNLRPNVDLDSTDDIDVRMDTRPDSVINSEPDSQTGVIQIGNENKNYQETSNGSGEADDNMAAVGNNEESLGPEIIENEMGPDAGYIYEEGNQGANDETDSEVVNVGQTNDETVESKSDDALEQRELPDEKLNEKFNTEVANLADEQSLSDDKKIYDERNTNIPSTDATFMDDRFEMSKLDDGLEIMNQVKENFTAIVNGTVSSNKTAEITNKTSVADFANKTVETTTVKLEIKKDKTLDETSPNPNLETITNIAMTDQTTMSTTDIITDTTDQLLLTTLLTEAASTIMPTEVPEDETTTDSSTQETTTEESGLENRLDTNAIKTLVG